MQRVVLVLILLDLLGTNAVAQGGPADWRTALQAREDAQRANDPEIYGKFVTDDFMLTDDKGAVTTASAARADIAERKRTGARPSLPLNRFDERVRVYQNTVIYTYAASSMASDVTKRYTQVWVKQIGQWKLANFQASLLETPKR